MALRPYWSGNLRLSLVTLPVNVYSALNRSRQIPLKEIYRKTGERVHRLNVTEDGTEVERDEIIKGYEVQKGQYVLIETDEIKDLKIPSSRTLDIVQFVPAEEIDDLYFDTPYFVAPQKDADEQTFAVIRDALRHSKTTGIGQLAIAGRERLCTIRPCGSGLILQTLRYEDELRDSDPYFDDITEKAAASEELDLARELIKRKTAKFDPGRFHDHYREALQELIEAKVENREPVAVENDQPAAKVINLMDALRKSLKEPPPRPNEVKPKRKTPAKRKKSPAKTGTRKKAS
ncbi:Ku protein [Asticcacaulis excentricus]|uniref:Non-homologous end joining protein Ku n=1 Tax=Asticcacaulis excentricus (strain ATCC 15261 / DSM 4724 / KCTC 12464 / NCIMB 9791 / VKM B-1370 / CB 48) TaxID=573065 RepID=E8RP71_ASTEC|nr:Ku protein [Asticcacaulis excentricus]ADU13041.1 Ku protein [Asticcacaulis excentricus CB 48]